MTLPKFVATLTAIASLLVAFEVQAGEETKVFKGIVTTVSAADRTMTLKEKDGEETKTFTLPEGVRLIDEKDAPLELQTVEEGDKARINYSKEGEKLVAIKVRISDDED